MFWEQSAAQVQGARIWENFQARGKRVAMLFWQQSLGETADVILSPAPIHRHHGGMIEACYSKPAGLYEELCRRVGRPFRLRQYWGPMASGRAGQWIVEATLALLGDSLWSPDLCLTYLPTLDYALQREDPEHHPSCSKTLLDVQRQLSMLVDGAVCKGYEVVVLGEYRIEPVKGAVFPNRRLREAGLLQTRSVKGMSYPDLYGSRAFAVVDHQIAHVYVSSARDLTVAKEYLSALPGVDRVLDREEQADIGVHHENSGDLLMVAGDGTWLAYPWWRARAEAPDYAGHVDIHNKPGYDPCELFFGWPPGSVSRNTARIRGSHGRVGSGREVVWACTFSLCSRPKDLIELAEAVRLWLDKGGT